MTGPDLAPAPPLPTSGDGRPRPIRPRRSAVWSFVWPAGYRVLRVLDPLIRSLVANDLAGLGRVVELRFTGRRTGRSRRVLVTLLRHDGRWYVGHPNGDAGWTRDIQASGWVDVEPHGLPAARMTVVTLLSGAERDAVIRVTAMQQPFPANLLYRAARRHIAAVGVYHRLAPMPAATAEPARPTAEAAPQTGAASTRSARTRPEPRTRASRGPAPTPPPTEGDR